MLEENPANNHCNMWSQRVNVFAFSIHVHPNSPFYFIIQYNMVKADSTRVGSLGLILGAGRKKKMVVGPCYHTTG